MKFTEGYWRMRPEVTAYFPAQVYDVETTPDSLTVYAPTRTIRHRSDTLNTATLSLRFSSPAENVIRVQLDHFKGVPRSSPQFPIFAGDPPRVHIQDDDQAASLTSGRLTVRINKGDDWRVDFKDGEKAVTNSAWRRARAAVA